MELAGLKPTDAQVLNMRPPEIAAAWARGDIDAAFIWDPVLADGQEERQGARDLGRPRARRATCTFDGLVVSKKFAAENKDFMVALVKAIAKADADYRANTKAWAADKDKVAAVAKWSGAKPEDVADAMALYAFPTAAEQASPTWLGGGANGGAAKALTETARFLKDQGRIQQLAPDYSKSVNPAFAAAAAK